MLRMKYSLSAPSLTHRSVNLSFSSLWVQTSHMPTKWPTTELQSRLLFLNPVYWGTISTQQNLTLLVMHPCMSTLGVCVLTSECSHLCNNHHNQDTESPFTFLHSYAFKLHTYVWVLLSVSPATASLPALHHQNKFINIQHPWFVKS